MAGSDGPGAGPGSCRFAVARLIPLLDSFAKEIGGVREGKDIEYVHRMRVASRRLRAALPLFSVCFGADEYRSWMQELKKITRALGEARDTDVQIDFLRSYAKKVGKTGNHKGAGDRGQAALAAEIRVFLHRLGRKRSVLQDHVVSALDDLERSGVLAGMRGALTGTKAAAGRPLRRMQAIGIPGVAADRIGGRLEEFLAFEPYLADPDAITEHHAMRIAAKKLRYTMEVYGPVYRLSLKKPLRRVKKVQEILGDIHDCDVWIDTLTRMIVRQRTRSRPVTVPEKGVHTLTGMRLFLHDRERKRHALHRRMIQYWNALGRAHAWEELGTSLIGGVRTGFLPRVQGKPGATAAAVASLMAESPDHQTHEAQVTRLALALFDQTQAIHHLGLHERTLLEQAGLLHDIGWRFGRKGHSSRGREMILGEERLPFALADRIVIAIAVRSHRKGIDPITDTLYPFLPAQGPETVRILSALLRVADGLDYLHSSVVETVSCAITPDGIIVTAAAAGDAGAERARALAKSELMKTAFGREVEIR